MHFNPQIEQLIQQSLQLTSQGQFAQALAGFDQVRRADAAYANDNPQIQFAAGQCLAATGRVEAALAAFRRVSELLPNNVAAKLELARIHRRTGNDASAYIELSKALQLEPDNLRGVCQMAEHAMDQGDFTTAQKMLDPHIALLRAGASNDVMMVLAFARLAPLADREEEALELLTRVANNPELSPSVRFALLKAMVVCEDKLGRFEDALEHCKEAHTLTSVSYDAEAHSERVDRLIETWTSDAMSALPRAEHVPGKADVVFVIGFPGSGTTLVERTIGAHPDAIACGELPGLRRIAMHLDPDAAPGVPMLFEPGKLEKEFVENAAKSYMQMVDRVLALLAPGLNPGYVTDKNGINAFYLPTIASVFPNCRVIHVKRDPTDACVTHHLNLFGGAYPYSRDISRLGRYYRDFERTMDHWRSNSEALGVRFHEVQYESFVNNHESTAKEIIEFAGLDWDDTCLNFMGVRPAGRTTCIDEVRMPVFESHIGRHKHYTDLLSALRSGLGGAAVS
ncbi:MAG: sulfotransferase family protein [Phycisphaera sp.]|nr:MAG: sulfotransferase family protein [Phycisphaera sp.]